MELVKTFGYGHLSIKKEVKLHYALLLTIWLPGITIIVLRSLLSIFDVYLFYLNWLCFAEEKQYSYIMNTNAMNSLANNNKEDLVDRIYSLPEYALRSPL